LPGGYFHKKPDDMKKLQNQMNFWAKRPRYSIRSPPFRAAVVPGGCDWASRTSAPREMMWNVWPISVTSILWGRLQLPDRFWVGRQLLDHQPPPLVDDGHVRQSVSERGTRQVDSARCAVTAGPAARRPHLPTARNQQRALPSASIRLITGRSSGKHRSVRKRRRVNIYVMGDL
jgi:hypothetical protein